MTPSDTLTHRAATYLSILNDAARRREGAQLIEQLLARVRELEAGLTWTDAKPTVPGWYWYRDDLGDHKDSWGMLKYPGGETIFDEGFSHPLDEFAGQFAGPLPAPKEIPAK